MSPANLPLPDSVLAYLEHYPEPGGHVQRIPLAPLPFRIGRSPDAHFTIYSRQVSKEHAEIDRRGESFTIADLGSRNGTFVNGEPIALAELRHSDIIHVADKAFKFGCDPGGPPADDFAITESATSRLPFHVSQAGQFLRELLAGRLIRTLFHPIFHLETRVPVAYEALGRGDHPGLNPGPVELFRLAEKHHLAPELSRLFRAQAFVDAAHLPGEPLLFFNIHPLEMEASELLPALAAMLPDNLPPSRLVLEVHENVVADVARLKRLRDEARRIGCGIAFDDFGAGQSRLAELTEAAPDFVKLDRKLIEGIDQAEARQEIIHALARVSRSLGCQLIAEGIETEAEAEVCRQLGCRFGQGFLFGFPQPARHFQSASASVKG